MLTTEQMLDRWEDMHTIENLMGKRAFLTLLVRDQRVFEEMWSRNEPCFGMNNGYYRGYEAVAGYFAGLRAIALKKAQLAKSVYKEELSDEKDEDLIGVGAIHGNNLTTPVIEVAADRKTAKGLWYLIDGDVDFGISGRETAMKWGRLGVDFIKENGAWKIWHIVYAEDINCPMGHVWTKKRKVNKAPVFGALANEKLPEPNVPVALYEHWYNKRQPKAFPPVPKPYATFTETFSYGK